MALCGLYRRKHGPKSQGGEKARYGTEKPKQPAQAAHPTFATHQHQHQGPRPASHTRNLNFSQASTIHTPSTPPLYQARPRTPPRQDHFLPLMKQQSPFRGIPDITVSAGPSTRPGSGTTSHMYQDSAFPVVDSPPPSLRRRLAARPESRDGIERPRSLSPSTVSEVGSVTISNSSSNVSLVSPALALRPQLQNSSTDSLGRLSPAPPIPRVSSKRIRPRSLPASAPGVPNTRRQSPQNIPRKPVQRAPNVPSLQRFSGAGALRVPPSACGVGRSDTVASRYDEGQIDEEDDVDWVPPVPGLKTDAYLGLVGESRYSFLGGEVDWRDGAENLGARVESYKRGCARSVAKGGLNTVDRVQGCGFGVDESRSKGREFENRDYGVPQAEVERQADSLPDVPAIRVVSAGESAGGFGIGNNWAEAQWSLRESPGVHPMGLSTPKEEKSIPAAASLRVVRSSGLIVDVPVLRDAPRPPNRQERQARGRIEAAAAGNWQYGKERGM